MNQNKYKKWKQDEPTTKFWSYFGDNYDWDGGKTKILNQNCRKVGECVKR